jgi:hypothetical protein
MKVWTCYPGVGQQNWYYTSRSFKLLPRRFLPGHDLISVFGFFFPRQTDDQRIAITGGNQCLDLGPSGPQTYQCTGGNTNQIWTLGSTPPPPVNNTTSQIHRELKR